MTVYGIWGVFGFIALLAQAIYRLSPIAWEAVTQYQLTIFQWFCVVASVIFVGISEGYKGFQKQVAPRVVSRAATLSSNSPILHKIFAPLFCMALFHATRKRLIVSWSVYVGIVILIVIVRQLEQPYRGAVDAGVVVGLSWGIVALLAQFIGVSRGKPRVDPEIPW